MLTRYQKKNVTNNLLTFKNKLYIFLNNIKSLFLFYIGWICLHYICSQFYIYYCVPSSLYGLFISPFLSMTPHCVGFRWVIFESGNIFYTMWMAIGTWTVSNILAITST
jgi:hypothetical protein